MNKLLSVIMSLAVALALLCGSIAVPILVRPFYYAQIEPLGLEESSGLSREEIIEAYDEVLDFCTGVSAEFSAGVLPFSEDGEAHFADCRRLFILDFVVFGASVLTVAALYLRDKRKSLHHFGSRRPAFWGAAVGTAALALIGLLATADFNRAFTVFHTVFFPGKDNWIFNASTDPVIRIMPERFFLNCAVLIAAVYIVSAALVMITSQKKKP